MLRRAEEITGAPHGPREALRAEVVSPAFQQDCGEGLRHQLLHDGDILRDELLLEVDGVGGNDRFPFVAERGQDGGEQIGQRFPHPCAGFDDDRTFFLQRLPGLHGHALLLLAVFKVGGLGQQSIR